MGVVTNGDVGAPRDSTQKLTQELTDLTPQLVSSVLEYNTRSAGTVQDAEGREKIVAAAQAIIDSVRPPQPTWMSQGSANAEFVALRLFIEWGVFEAMPSEGTITYQELADKVGAEMQLVRRLAWNMVSTGLLEQEGPDGLKHTPKSRHITENKNLKAMWQLMFDNSFTCSTSLPNYFRTYGRKEPTQQNHVPLPFAYGAPDKTFWEVWNADQNRASYFMDAMTVIGKEVPLMGPIEGLYDFSWLAEHPAKRDTGRKLLVDVGGGRGHCIKSFCAVDSPLSTERCVLQDSARVVDQLKSEENSELPGTDIMAIDFHQSQPVKGALIYYMRHCMHNYPDEVVLNMIKIIADAMADDSKLLIAEYVMSNPPSKMAIWMDYIMFMSGGKERTADMWEELISRAGLKIKGFHGLGKSPDGHAVIECVKS